jgi:hypothetical protein
LSGHAEETKSAGVVSVWFVPNFLILWNLCALNSCDFTQVTGRRMGGLIPLLLLLWMLSCLRTPPPPLQDCEDPAANSGSGLCVIAPRAHA